MSTVTTALKRKMDASEEIEVKKEKREMSFKSYGVLPPELRAKILSFNSLPTLQNYSALSPYCNSEIQRFNTKAPGKLELLEDADGVLVQMYTPSYENAEFHLEKKKLVEKRFKSSAETDTIQDIKNHLQKFFKYIKYGPASVHVNMRTWSEKIFELRQIAKIDCLLVTMNPTMYDDFIEWCESTTFCSNFLTLMSSEKVEHQIVVGADFFKSKFARNIKYLGVQPNCQIDRDDFLSLSGKSLHIKTWIDVDAIRQKMSKINDLFIEVPKECPQKYNIDQLFPRDQFDVVHNRRHNCYKIGESKEVKISNDGETLRLDKFYERDSDEEEDSDEEFSDDEEFDIYEEEDSDDDFPDF